MFKKLFSSNSGQVAVNFALAAIPLVVGTGMAVDFSRGAAASQSYSPHSIPPFSPR